MEEEEVRNPVSRRRIIKRAGVGAAAVWSAPVLTSLGTAAHAASPGPSDCSGTNWTCGQAVETCSGEPVTPPGCGDAVCVCDVDTEGRTFCWNNYCCSDTTACASSDDCAGDARCVSSCCSEGSFTCAPPCGAALATIGASPSASGSGAG